MTVAVFSALQPELDLMLDSLDRPVRSRIADWPIWQGSLRGRPVTLARAGLGKVNIASLSALVWERHRPSLLVLTGVAGGLDPELRVGDMVIGEKCLQHDAGVITPGGRLERYQAGHVPFLNPTDQHGFFPSARVLATMRRVMADTALTPVLDRTPHVRFGTILTGDQFLRDSVTRDRFHAETGARAIEMEGAALGQVAQHLDVDHLVIRSLSDLAADDAEADFDRFLPEVSANSARLVLGLISRLEEDDGNHSIGT